MIRADIEFPRGLIDEFKRFSVQRLERAMLKAADKASRKAQGEVRVAMAGAGLGRLGQAVGQFSDEKKGRGVHRLAGESFSASGGLSIRSKSERTIGAIRAYTEGAQIVPVKGRWLWIASDQLQRIVGTSSKKRRLTPALYKSGGLEQKIGPLVPVRRPNGYPMLIVNNVGVSAAGKPRSAKSLKRNGQPRKGQIGGVSIIAFVAIPQTSRAMRVDVNEIIRRNAALVGGYVNSELQKG